MTILGLERRPPAALATHGDFASITHDVIGHDLVVRAPYGEQMRLYINWTATVREYRPIEELLHGAPWMANTHTERSAIGRAVTAAHHQARSPTTVLHCVGDRS